MKYKMRMQTSMRACAAKMIYGMSVGLIGLASLLALPGAVPQALAHGGQIEVGSGARGPVQLSARQQQAIALKVAPASFRPMEKVLNLNGVVQGSPNHQADVTLRISGQVTAIYANLGETVRVGQKLARVQSRLIGDPPPSVTITAPMGGMIDARNIVLGQAVEPNTVLFHISNLSQLIVVARVYEEDVGKIRLGQEARVRVLGLPGQTYAGSVTFVSPALNPVNRTLAVWIRITNPRGLLKLNMFAQAAVVLQRTNSALTVPNAAVLEANGEKFVFVREGDKYHRVEVATGARDDQYTEITHGLVPGDEVVTQGNREIYTMWMTGGQLQDQDGD